MKVKRLAHHYHGFTYSHVDVDFEALDGITAIKPSKVTLRQFDLASGLVTRDPLYNGIDLLQPYSVR